MRRIVGWYLRRRRVALVIPTPEYTFHLEIQPDGTVKPVLSDPTALAVPYAGHPDFDESWRT